MSGGALSTRRVEGVGEGSLPGTLARLLQLTCEAVVVFDGAGRVLLVNDEAQELLGGEGELVGSDVRLLFPDPDVDAVAPLGPFSVGQLPFPVDGSAARVVGRRGAEEPLRVRCEAVQAPGETYLVVALPLDERGRSERDEERELRELARANHRLSGTLDIVLETLDIDDLGALFRRLLERITQMMEADGTVVYLAEADGFHLRGLSSSLLEERVPRFMPFGRSVERLAVREGSAVRLRVRAPGVDDLRQGRLATRDVVNEDTREILRMRSDMLPPFTSFVAVPVWFGGRIFSIIEVGWLRVHPLAADDARLLDSLARYLSVQFAGAFTELRSQRASRLVALGSKLREELLADDSAKKDADAAEGTPPDRVESVFRTAADELDCVLARVSVNVSQRLCVAELPAGGVRELPVDVDALSSAYERDGVAVVPLTDESPLSVALHELGEPCVGVLVDLGTVGGERRRYLLLRPADAEPLDELALEFVQTLAEDVRSVVRGEEAREQDKRIAQALQTGMRNELQDVPGITAEAVYSSATRAAFVGGDFYDLIRLPGRRACVIMGDVSGKGVEAASVSAAVKTALGAYAWEGLAPARMVRALNEFLLGFSRLETFATLFVGIVNLAEGTIRYCSAGHPPAILVGAGADELSILDVQSGVVGAFRDITYVDGLARFSAGDVLLLYTDGTTEARDREGAFFGEEGLREAVMRESAGDLPFGGFVDRLLATLDDFTGNDLEDDVAIVALRFDEVG